METEDNNEIYPNAKDLFLISEKKTMTSSRLKRAKGDWVEDSFINYSSDEINKGNKNFIGLGLKQHTLNSFLVILFLIIGLLFARSAYLQIAKGNEYLEMAENNRIRIYHVQSPRGIIFDRNYQPLVKNVPNFSLYLTPVDFPKNPTQQEKIFTDLKNFFDEDLTADAQKILKINSTKKEFYQPQLLASNIAYEQALLLKIKTGDLSGLSVDVTQQRAYLSNLENDQSPYFYNSLSHLLGYVGKINEQEYEKLSTQGYLFNDNIGKTGIEDSYENILRGKYGKKQIEVDSLGKEIKVLAQEEVVKGDNIILTIDQKVQDKLESLLRNTLIESGKKKAVGIVQNPNNGEIIAMVSLPSYDNNLFARGIDQASYQTLLTEETNPLFNRAISGEYPSGSTIKPVIAAAALQEGIISESTTILSTGGISIGSWFFPDWRAGGHGVTTVKKALADSVNTFFYTIGGGYQNFSGLGVYKMKEYGEKFGLASLTGIDLPNEKPGFLPSPEWKEETKNEAWYIGDTYHMSIGQGDVLVTPLQISNYMSFFANSGILYKPHLLKAVIDSKTNQENQILPEVLNNNFIDNYNILIVRQGLRQTITSGSAQSLNSLPVTVAGKTGTAQWGTDNDPHAWFTCFAPYENPEIVVTILIEEGEEGSTISVPIANKFLYWYFTQYKMNY